MITDCDQATGTFCAENGNPQAEPRDLPSGVRSNWKAFVPEWLQEKVQDQDFKIIAKPCLKVSCRANHLMHAGR